MKFFTKNETKAVGLILLVIFVASFLNLRIALRRARDVSRRGDIRQLEIENILFHPGLMFVF